METGTLIISIVCLLLFVVPFVLLQRSGRKAKKEIINQLNKYVKENNFQLEKWDIGNNLALGIDTHNRIAFFIEDKENNDYEIKQVPLQEIQMCKLNNQTRKVQTGEGIEYTIQRLELCFQPKSKKDEMVCFTLFDESSEKRMGNELQLAKEWVDIFNQRIK